MMDCGLGRDKHSKAAQECNPGASRTGPSSPGSVTSAGLILTGYPGTLGWGKAEHFLFPTKNAR